MNNYADRNKAEFTKDLQKVVDILKKRGVKTAVIGMYDGQKFQQVLFGDSTEMIFAVASIERRIADLIPCQYGEVANAVKNVLMETVTQVNKNDNEIR